MSGCGPTPPKCRCQTLPEPRELRLVLVRHGESVWNSEGRSQGHGGTGLSERGHAQAQATAVFLARAYPDTVLLVRSDLQRVVETAAPAEIELGIDVHVDARLREIDVGTWSGLTYHEIAEKDPEGYLAWIRRGDTDVRRGGGETYAELRERVWPALRDALALKSEQRGTVLVFTHGGPIRVATAAALGLPTSAEARLAGVDNCSLTLLEWQDGLPRLMAYNRTHHLLSLDARDIERAASSRRDAPT